MPADLINHRLITRQLMAGRPLDHVSQLGVGDLVPGQCERGVGEDHVAALDEAAATRRIHGDGIETNFSVERVPGRRGGGTVLIIRRSPLLRLPADEL